MQRSHSLLIQSSQAKEQEEKMKLETEVISQKTVRPSSPTPHDLGRHKLSSLDQVVPTYFIPWLFFYPHPNKAKAKAKAKAEADIDNNNEEKKEESVVNRIIEKSLSEALTVFYPLAGRMKDNTHVECNDEGVHFVVARANCRMSVVLQNPHRCGINKLLPFKPDDPTEFLAFVQVTHFELGGMAIGLGFSHKIGDAVSSVMFVNTWAALARGGETKNISTAPRFDSATYFPPIPDISIFDPRFAVVKDKNIVTRRFVFSASSIATLRDKYTNKNGRRPTPFDALTLFIWSRFMATTQVDAEAEDKTYAVRFPVNLRPKMDPPLSEYHFGNIIVELVVEVPKEDELKSKLSAILRKMVDEISRIDSKYVKTIQDADDKYLNKIKKQAEQVDSGKVLPLDFTPCSSFPIYEVDFGWGKPAWVGSVGPYKNLVTYADTPKGDGGIEVLMYLTEQDMAKFEVDKDLAEFASVSPPQDYFTS